MTMATDVRAPEDREFVTGLANGLSVLSVFRSQETPLTQTQVSARTGLTRATARRSLITLKRLGYIAETPEGYRPTSQVMDLAASWLRDPTSWIEIVRPWLINLRDKVNQNVSAAVLDRGDVVYMVACPSNRVIALNISVGGRKPAFATAMGRVLLADQPESCARDVLERYPRPQFTDQTVTDLEELMAELARVRAQGFAEIAEELEPGLAAVSVPIRNGRGACLAALNVCGHVLDAPLCELREVCLPQAQVVAEKLRELLP